MFFLTSILKGFLSQLGWIWAPSWASKKRFFFFSFLRIFAQERSKSAQERSKSAQERSKSAPRAPQELPRAPKSVPRAPQERSKSAQERSKSAQERPKNHPKALYVEAYVKTNIFAQILISFHCFVLNCLNLQLGKIIEKPLLFLCFIDVFIK